jgi:hypothetical protein
MLPAGNNDRHEARHPEWGGRPRAGAAADLVEGSGIVSTVAALSAHRLARGEIRTTVKGV